MHNHYKRVKYEGKRRKKVAETSASQRSSKPLRQDAAATAAEMAAEASQQQGETNSSGDGAGAEAEDAAANRVKFSGRELPDVELDKSNVLLLVRGCLSLISWIGGLLAGCRCATGMQQAASRRGISFKRRVRLGPARRCWHRPWRSSSMCPLPWQTPRLSRRPAMLARWAASSPCLACHDVAQQSRHCHLAKACFVGRMVRATDAPDMRHGGCFWRLQDVESMLHKLLVAADGNVHQAQRGIVYIDEVDKITRSDGATMTRDVSGVVLTICRWPVCSGCWAMPASLEISCGVWSKRTLTCSA